MLHYPKMPSSRDAPIGRCVAFEKYDGTNLHWDWERGFGWHSFGPRRGEYNLNEHGMAGFARDHAHLQEAPALFLATLAEGVGRVLAENPFYATWQEFKVFTEFLGAHSFAGLHKTEDAKQLVLFDVWIEGYGFVGPHQFVQDFGHLNIARVVYEGKLTGQFVEDVRNGKFHVPEGVVCKGGSGGADVWMAKIKTYQYLDNLKAAFKGDWENYWE